MLHFVSLHVLRFSNSSLFINFIVYSYQSILVVLIWIIASVCINYFKCLVGYGVFNVVLRLNIVLWWNWNDIVWWDQVRIQWTVLPSVYLDIVFLIILHKFDSDNLNNNIMLLDFPLSSQCLPNAMTIYHNEKILK